MRRTARFTFFWGTRDPFSQWHPARFRLLEPWADDAQPRRTLEFSNAEQYMMAAKAACFGDRTRYDQIIATTDPKRAKALGRQVANFDERTWSAVARDHVRIANLAKFTQNPALRATLLDTGETLLVEASPYDRIWGIGLADDHPDAERPERWRGTNWLGEVLTEVRATIRAEAATAPAG